MLGEFPPPGGVTVTLSSNDPDKLLLSSSATAIGTKSIEITLSGDRTSVPYYLQGFPSKGTASYTASAPGFRSRTADVTFAPSGVVLTPGFYGPPDEAQVLRKEASDGTHRFTVKLDKPTEVGLAAWTVRLDPITHRSADITVQPLRPGLSLNVDLKNSNASVGEVSSTVTIEGGSSRGVAQFTALSAGQTEISVVTPKDFTPSANSTVVVGTVVK
jgi:hypothetical protein